MNRARLKELLAWRAETAKELDAAQAAAALATQRVEASKERLRLLDRLLAVEGAPAVSGGLARPEPAAGDELLDSCEKIVREAGKPLHIRDLHAALLKEGVEIPGRGTEANLLVRLHRSNGRFVRTGRGTYAPATLGAPEVRPTKTHRVARSSK